MSDTAGAPEPSVERADRQTGHCKMEYQTQPVQKRAAWAIVGELNNAYNDGTRGQFSYARTGTAETKFGMAYSDDGGDNFTIDGENFLSNGGRLTFARVSRRYARKLRSKFEFTRYAVRTDTCAKWSIYIRATAWLLGTDDSLKNRGTLNRCDAGYVGYERPGTEFFRDRNSATRWTRGVSVFGVNLTSQSGFSTDVTLDYRFGGKNGRRHYLCGPNGRQDPVVSGRVFSGAT